MGGRAWTPEEVYILRKIGESRESLIDNMHLLPGRSWDSAKWYASKHRISLAAASEWSPKEREVLRAIYRSRRSIKVQVAELLPKRNYNSARAEAIRLGIAAKGAGTAGRAGYSWVLRAIESTIEREGPLTSTAVAARIGAGVSSVNFVIRKNRSHFHIDGWIGIANHLSVVWGLGAHPDAPKPAPRTPQDHARVARARDRVRAGHFDPFATLIQQVAA